MKVLPHYLILTTATVFASLVRERDDGVSTYVDLSIQRGSPKHLASGFIYGIPDTFGQIPDHYYANIGFNYGRSGGAQESSPARGWIYGMENYKGRLNSTLTNYKTCREFDAKFIILPHDVWGTDGANSSTVWPGDNGDWSDYDKFLKQLMSDLKDNHALSGLVWDIWNEPDGTWFWNRTMQQWIDLYVRTHKTIRADPDFDKVLISGPTLWEAPYPDNTWFTNWLSQIKGNNTAPDQYAWHLEAAPGENSWSARYDLANAYPSLYSVLDSYGLPHAPMIINEYASYAEMVPAGAAWWISRLERYNTPGLRGNWQSGTALHDLMANLLTKVKDPFNYIATDYAPAPEYPVYQYYYQNMTGVRVNTTGSTNLMFDVYATAESKGKVRILAGSEVFTGTWSINVMNPTAVGLPSSGTVNIHTWAFGGDNPLSVAPAPQDLGIVAHSYANNVLSFPVYQTTNYTAYAFEFDAGKFNEKKSS